MAAAIINERIVRSTQIKRISFILIGMSVAISDGTDAEKNNTADTLVTATVNFVISEAFTTSIAGRNISAISTAAAFAASIGSGTCMSSVKG